MNFESILHAFSFGFQSMFLSEISILAIIVFSCLIGFFIGKNRRLGIFMSIFIGVTFSPLISLIITFFSSKLGTPLKSNRSRIYVGCIIIIGVILSVIRQLEIMTTAKAFLGIGFLGMGIYSIIDEIMIKKQLQNLSNQQNNFQNLQQPKGNGFNQWQNNTPPQQSNFRGYQAPQQSQQQGGFYNGGHNAGHQPQRPNPAPQQPQSPPQQPPRKNNGGDFNGDLYGKAK